jgi:Tfp pilus assembly protein PilF
VAADRHIPTWDTAYRPRPLVCWPGDAPVLSAPGQAASLEAERPNLQAAADYAAASGQHLHAVQIRAAMGGFLRERGHWDQATALHHTALTAARHAGDRAGQAGTLHELGLLETITGDFPAATVSLEQAVAL